MCAEEKFDEVLTLTRSSLAQLCCPGYQYATVLIRPCLPSTHITTPVTLPNSCVMSSGALIVLFLRALMMPSVFSRFELD